MSRLEELERYVARRLVTDKRIDYLLALASFAGGLLLVAGAYYFAIVVTWSAAYILGLDPSKMLIIRGIAGGFVLLAFFESWRSTRKLFEGYSTEFSASGAALSALLYATGVGCGPRGILPLSSGASKNLVRAAADFVCSGPRLLRNSVRFLRRARERSRADFQGCARVLETLLGSPRRVPLEDLAASLPRAQLPDVLEQLSWLGGVVFLTREPQGLALTDALREELESAVVD